MAESDEIHQDKHATIVVQSFTETNGHLQDVGILGLEGSLDDCRVQGSETFKSPKSMDLAKGL